MASATLEFCERSAELGLLIERWHLASAVQNPTPQVVLIKAERGIGKTRLALEFYRWLSETVDAAGPDGYWPDAVNIINKNLEPNPNAQDCNFTIPIPYLWWGLRAGDRGAENGVAGDAIATYDQFLSPHLVALLVRANMRSRALNIAEAWASVGLDLAASVVHLDAIVSIGKGIFETAKILSGSIGGNTPDEALERPVSRANLVLSKMEKVFDPKAKTRANTPGVIFLDDTQFLHEDAALPSFVERLMHKAITERWPLMILVTHWKRELSAELMPSELSFASILRHGRQGQPSEPSSTTGLAGGYLNDDNYAEIDLGPVSDLSTALFDKMPGVTIPQAEALLENTGGNPRFLEQVIEFLLENEGFFEEFDPSKPLTAKGLEEALNEMSAQDIFKVVFRRLRQAPEEVQQAICIASLQGVRFANDLVEAVAKAHIGQSIRDPLRKAEDPFSMVTGTNVLSEGKIGRFVERLFQQVAQQRRPSIGSLGGEVALQIAFKTTISDFVKDLNLAKSASSDTKMMAYGVAANLFEHSHDRNERSTAQKALGELARLELSNTSFESAAAAYERLLAIVPASGTLSEWVSRVETWRVLVSLYCNLNWPSRRSHALKGMMNDAFDLIMDERRVFIFAIDQDAVRENFRRWKEEHSTRDPQIYLMAVLVIVRGLLGLSELARVWPRLSFNEGDDPVGEAPFLVRRGVGIQDDSDDAGDQTPEHLDISAFLSERAYNLGAILENEVVEREHLKLLDQLAEQANRDSDFAVAEDALQRSLPIAEKLRDEIERLQILNNLGIIMERRADLSESERYLDKAKGLIDGILSEQTFRVNLMVDDDSQTDDSKKSRTVGTVEVPSRFSDEFDKEPNATVDKVWRLKQLAGNLYGNLAGNAQGAGRSEEAKKGYCRALELHREINDLPNMATDLENLAGISASGGDRASACSYWSECLSIYEELRRRDADGILDNIWQQRTKRLSDIMLEAGCAQGAS